MSSNGRGSMRPQGRSPPFLLIGLVVALVILGANYWTLTSSNSKLAYEVAELQDQVRQLSAKRISAEKKIDSMAESYNRNKDSLTRKESDVKSLNSQLTDKADQLLTIGKDKESCQNNLKNCEENSNGIQQELQKVKEELETINEKEQQQESNTQKCESVCADMRKMIITAVEKTMGINAVSNLHQAGIDVGEFKDKLGAVAQGQAQVDQNINLTGGAQPGQNLNPAGGADQKQPVQLKSLQSGQIAGEVQPQAGQGQDNRLPPGQADVPARALGPGPGQANVPGGQVNVVPKPGQGQTQSGEVQPQPGQDQAGSNLNPLDQSHVFPRPGDSLKTPTAQKVTPPAAGNPIHPVQSNLIPNNPIAIQQLRPPGENPPGPNPQDNHGNDLNGDINHQVQHPGSDLGGAKNSSNSPISQMKNLMGVLGQNIQNSIKSNYSLPSLVNRNSLVAKAGDLARQHLGLVGLGEGNSSRLAQPDAKGEGQLDPMEAGKEEVSAEVKADTAGKVVEMEKKPEGRADKPKIPGSFGSVNKSVRDTTAKKPGSADGYDDYDDEADKKTGGSPRVGNEDEEEYDEDVGDAADDKLKFVPESTRNRAGAIRQADDSIDTLEKKMKAQVQQK